MDRVLKAGAAAAVEGVLKKEQNKLVGEIHNLSIAHLDCYAYRHCLYLRCKNFRVKEAKFCALKSWLT